MPTLPKIFRSVTQNTLIFLFGLTSSISVYIDVSSLWLCFLTLLVILFRPAAGDVGVWSDCVDGDTTGSLCFPGSCKWIHVESLSLLGSFTSTLICLYITPDRQQSKTSKLWTNEDKKEKQSFGLPFVAWLAQRCQPFRFLRNPSVFQGRFPHYDFGCQNSAKKKWFYKQKWYQIKLRMLLSPIHRF